MLNIEKYKDEIVSEIDKDPRIGYALVNVARSHGFNSCLNPYNGDDPKEYNKEVLNWLLSEHKEPILTDEEREYLSAVCKPFEVDCIYKHNVNGSSYGWLCLMLNGEHICLPQFKIETMYKGMKFGIKYTPQELGVTCKNNRSKND